MPISAFILPVHSDMKTHPKHRELPAALAKTRPAFHKNNLVPHAALDARCSQTIYQRLSDGLAHRRIPQPPRTSHKSFTFIFPCPWNSSKSVCAMRQQTRPALCPLLLLPPRTCLAAVALSGCRVESGFCRAKKNEVVRSGTGSCPPSVLLMYPSPLINIPRMVRVCFSSFKNFS